MSRSARASLCIVFATLVLGNSRTSWAQVSIAPGETHVFGDPFPGCQSDVGNGITSGGTCGTDSDPKNLLIGTALSVSVAESVSIRGVLSHPFTVTGTNPTVLDATVSASISWNGRLFAGGVAGTSSAVSLRLVLQDTTTNAIAGSATLHSESCQGTILTACERNDSGSTSGGFPAKVTRGHSYELFLEARCSSDSGLVGTNANCLYLPNAILSIFGPAHGRVRLDAASIAIQPDLFELIKNLNDKVDALQSSVDALQHSVDGIRVVVDGNSLKLDETIRLLNTPPGQRSSDLPACDGVPCDFPNHPGNGGAGATSLAPAQTVDACLDAIAACRTVLGAGSSASPAAVSACTAQVAQCGPVLSTAGKK
jgi:hypothetical protein